MGHENIPEHREDDPAIIDTGGLPLDPAEIARMGGSSPVPMTPEEFDRVRAQLDAEIAAQNERNSGNA